MSTITVNFSATDSLGATASGSAQATATSSSGWTLGQPPFASTSLWNQPIASNATFTSLPWPATTGYNYSANWSQYSAPVYVSSPSDPLCTVTYGAGQGYSAGSVQLNIPSGATGAPGGDGEIVIIDGTTVWNFWVFSRTSDTVATANQQGHCDVITGTGFGNFSGGQGAGIMACGASGFGGMLIQAETDAGPILHALQLSPLNTLVAPGFVAPAIRGDGNTSGGMVQEGDLLAIPPGTAMPTGLSTIGQQIFTALQTYGCYVVDVSGGDSTLRMQQNAYNQTVANNAWHDSNKIIPLLQKVS